jgi:CRISPR system Cascade subunit CasE
MLYLSKVVLDGRSGAARRDLADCRELHRTVMRAFPAVPAGTGGAREAFGVLFRVEPATCGGGAALTLLVQSRERPDWARLPEGYLAPQEPKRVDEYYQGLRAGQVLRFRLRANPTKRISANNDRETARWQGKRVELQREEDQVAWLARKGEQGGFRLLHVHTGADVVDARTDHGLNVLGYRRDAPEGRRRMTFGSVLFEGRLAITDADSFRRTLGAGIGSGKAYGFGLLSVAPAS